MERENFSARIRNKRKLEYVIARIRSEAAEQGESINQTEAFERLIERAYKDAGGKE